MTSSQSGLYRLTDRVWVFPYEQDRDRPNLGYIRGDRWSLAVDAGHSADHIAAFYAALEREGLPRPALTVLTHWHWDHTLAMHAAHGLTLAGEKTAAHLRDFRERLGREGTGAFLAFDERIRREYAGGQPVVITLPDLVFSGEMALDAGNCPVRVFRADAPHTVDSTLIHVPGEGVLFIGDAGCGALPDWKKDPALAQKLADTVRSTGAALCVEGHWEPLANAEAVQAVLAEE